MNKQSHTPTVVQWGDMSRIELCYEDYENFENSQTHQESLKHVRGAQRELQILRKL